MRLYPPSFAPFTAFENPKEGLKELCHTDPLKDSSKYFLLPEYENEEFLCLYEEISTYRTLKVLGFSKNPFNLEDLKKRFNNLLKEIESRFPESRLEEIGNRFLEKKTPTVRFFVNLRWMAEYLDGNPKRVDNRFLKPLLRGIGGALQRGTLQVAKALYLTTSKGEILNELSIVFSLGHWAWFNSTQGKGKGVISQMDRFLKKLFYPSDWRKFVEIELIPRIENFIAQSGGDNLQNLIWRFRVLYLFNKFEETVGKKLLRDLEKVKTYQSLYLESSELLRRKIREKLFASTDPSLVPIYGLEQECKKLLPSEWLSLADINPEGLFKELEEFKKLHPLCARYLEPKLKELENRAKERLGRLEEIRKGWEKLKGELEVYLSYPLPQKVREEIENFKRRYEHLPPEVEREIDIFLQKAKELERELLQRWENLLTSNRLAELWKEIKNHRGVPLPPELREFISKVEKTASGRDYIPSLYGNETVKWFPVEELSLGRSHQADLFVSTRFVSRAVYLFQKEGGTWNLHFWRTDGDTPLTVSVNGMEKTINPYERKSFQLPERGKIVLNTHNPWLYLEYEITPHGFLKFRLVATGRYGRYLSNNWRDFEFFATPFLVGS